MSSGGQVEGFCSKLGIEYRVDIAKCKAMFSHQEKKKKSLNLIASTMNVLQTGLTPLI